MPEFFYSFLQASGGVVLAVVFFAVVSRLIRPKTPDVHHPAE